MVTRERLPDLDRCTRRTKDGRPCRLYAAPGVPACWYHADEGERYAARLVQIVEGELRYLAQEIRRGRA